MELYECATQIDSISEPLQPALIEGKSTNALKKMDQSIDNSRPSTCTTVTGTSDRSSLRELDTNPPDESRSTDPSSSDLEILSDSGSTKKTWVNVQNYTEKQQQKNTTTRESNFLSLKVKTVSKIASMYFCYKGFNQNEVQINYLKRLERSGSYLIFMHVYSLELPCV